MHEAAACNYFLSHTGGPQTHDRQIRDSCCDFKNIFAEKFSEIIGVFDSKQS
jgi:hypothetical protein